MGRFKIETKRCFNCGKTKYLFLFKKDNSKYQLKSNKGRCIKCRRCSIKQSIKNGGYLQRVDRDFIFIKANKLQILKNFLKK